MTVEKDHGYKKMILGVEHIAKWNYIRAAVAFRRAVKLAPDELMAEIRRVGAEGQLRTASKLHSNFAEAANMIAVTHGYDYDMLIGHKIKAAIARKMADSFAKKDEEVVEGKR